MRQSTGLNNILVKMKHRPQRSPVGVVFSQAFDRRHGERTNVNNGVKKNGVVSTDHKDRRFSCVIVFPALALFSEAFEKVQLCLVFNLELKFDDYIVYEQEYLIKVLQIIMKVVYEYT
ncbi:unnamed protein product [Lactuca virosa]|uniref:Uncharacterized protein n=1 Tax=Lactuca virosa TaxID=75947 RepID=A0AAU9NDG4_9ASTR|nr:unnamed protein product [Lactuca virosa]